MVQDAQCKKEDVLALQKRRSRWHGMVHAESVRCLELDFTDLKSLMGLPWSTGFPPENISVIAQQFEWRQLKEVLVKPRHYCEIAVFPATMH